MKFSILLNVLLAAAVAWLLWSKNATSVGKNSYAVDSPPDYSSCYNCVTDDIHGETAEEFADVTARYYTTHASLYNDVAKSTTGVTSMPALFFKGIGAPEDFKDARSCWFSSDTIKKFICIMEKYAAKLEMPSANLGIRFYYADYGANAFDPKFINRHTLYMVPTAYNDKDGSFVDFEPKSSADKGSIVTISDFLPADPKNPKDPKYLKYKQPIQIVAGQTGSVAVVNKSAATGAATTTNVSTNQGDLCPPNTGCSSTLVNVDALHPAPYQ